MTESDHCGATVVAVITELIRDGGSHQLADQMIDEVDAEHAVRAACQIAAEAIACLNSGGGSHGDNHLQRWALHYAKGDHQ